MQNVAVGFARALRSHCECFVATRETDHVYSEPFSVHPILTMRVDDDLERLLPLEADAWLFMNAGYAPLAGRMKAPTFFYCHGNDFLNPWCRTAHLSSIGRSLSSNWLIRKTSGAYRLSRTWREMRCGFEEATRIFANSRPTAQRLSSKFRIDPSRVEVVHPGVDDCFFQSHEARRDDVYRLLTVSRMDTGTRRKNVDNVLRAVAAIQDITLQYTIVGDGNDRARIEALAAELNLRSRVRFLGSLNREQLLQQYRQNDLFVLVPKRRRFDIEGFGIVYIEAAASGVPSLAPNYGGSADAVKPSVNGISVPSASASAIEKGIREMWRRRGDFPEDRLRQFAEEFRWPVVTAQLYRQISEAIAT
jgi:phosphatidylinositol alpha-1,6-mannosyltransferase